MAITDSEIIAYPQKAYGAAHVLIESIGFRLMIDRPKTEEPVRFRSGNGREIRLQPAEEEPSFRLTSPTDFLNLH